MEKTVIVINGRGGVGKDTLCDAAAGRFRTMNVSAIDPIKEMASMCGWHGEKTDTARKFLSDLKQLTVDYSDYPTRWLLDRFEEFRASDREILFVHIREGAEIDKLVREIHSRGGRVVTLLIRRGSGRIYGNASDDNVEDHPYDLIYENNKPLEEAARDFTEFLERSLQQP